MKQHAAPQQIALDRLGSARQASVVSAETQRPRAKPRIVGVCPSSDVGVTRHATRDGEPPVATKAAAQRAPLVAIMREVGCESARRRQWQTLRRVQPRGSLEGAQTRHVSKGALWPSP